MLAPMGSLGSSTGPAARRFAFGLIALGSLASACSTATPTRRPPAPAATAAPGGRVTVVRRRMTPYPRRLYGADEALKDALSSGWEFIGTGPWPGLNRTDACVFRNQRVFIVSAYCTITEQHAFRVDVYSPKRGRTRIYAEANGPVSARTRNQYFTFLVESEPPAGAATGLTLSMSFPELRSYAEQQADSYPPVCYGGEQLNHEKRGCLGKLKGREQTWGAHHTRFLTHASADWYQLVQKVRSLAPRYGRDP